MHSMATKNKKRYWAPTSQVFTIQPVRILDNSLTDYTHGNLNDSIFPFEQPTLESLLGFPGYPPLP